LLEKVNTFQQGVSRIREHHINKVVYIPVIITLVPTQRKHTTAMADSFLPRDYLASLHKYMLYEEGSEETEFQNIHLAACELLDEKRPGYNPRRNESYSIPLAFLMLIKKDVEKKDDDGLKRLFVDIFGDQQSFLQNYAEHLEKADAVFDQLTKHERSIPSVHKDFVNLEDDETIDSKLEKLMDKFEDVSVVERTKYVKGFDEKNGNQILAVAHTKLDYYDNTWTMLNFPSGLPAGFVKPFTRPGASCHRGKDKDGVPNVVGATCKIFPLKKMKESLQERIRKKYNMKIPEVTENDNDEIACSQDFPEVQIDKFINPLKICKICQFATNEKEEMKKHMNEHRECSYCGEIFTNIDTLKIHQTEKHETYRCNVCGEEVSKHMKAEHETKHSTEEAFENGLEKGKVTKKRKMGADESEPKKPRKLSAYQIWCRKQRTRFAAQYEEENLTKPTLGKMSKIMGAEWKQLTRKEQEEWETISQRVLVTGESVPETIDVEPEKSKLTCPLCEYKCSSETAMKDHFKSHMGGEDPIDENVIAEMRDEAHETIDEYNLDQESNLNIFPEGLTAQEDELAELLLIEDNLGSLVTDLSDAEITDRNEDIAIETIEITGLTDVPEVEEVEEEHAKVTLVMVKVKILWWPAIVKSEDDEHMTIEILNAKKKVMSVKKDLLKPFVIDHNQMDGMKRVSICVVFIRI
jgi:hypothetical protein